MIVDRYSSTKLAVVPRGATAVNIARNYIFHLMPKVRGYLSTVDALAMASILIGQSDASLGGGIVEIGTFFGRSFYLMAVLRNGHEKALAIDLFDIDQFPGGDSGQLRCFFETGRRMGIKLERDMALIGDTQCLSAENIRAKTGPVRFFSIDGGHDLREVLHDISLAADTISDYGVICFDDFCNPEWPEVTFAIFDFLQANAGHFAPFLISQKKLFVCKRPYLDFYSQLAGKASALHKVEKTSISLLGHKTMVVRSTPLEYLRCEGFARAGFGRLNMLLY